MTSEDPQKKKGGIYRLYTARRASSRASEIKYYRIAAAPTGGFRLRLRGGLGGRGVERRGRRFRRGRRCGRWRGRLVFRIAHRTVLESS